MPRMMETAVITMTAMVVTLMPPPVEPGAAPTNMRTIEKTLVESRMAYKSTELKPAVRMVTDCISEAPIFSFIPIGCKVAGLFHSNSIKQTVPMKIKKAVVNKTTFVCSSRVLVLRYASRSFQTIKPSPPTIISAMMVKITRYRPLKVISEVYSPKKPKISKPALQKADTAKKMAINTPCNP